MVSQLCKDRCKLLENRGEISFFRLVANLHGCDIPRLAMESELQLPTYTIATATWDPSHLCNLHHSSRQHQILHPLSGARDWTRNLMDTSQVHYPWAVTGRNSPWLWFSMALVSSQFFLWAKWLQHLSTDVQMSVSQTSGTRHSSSQFPLSWAKETFDKCSFFSFMRIMSLTTCELCFSTPLWFFFFCSLSFCFLSHHTSPKDLVLSWTIFFLLLFSDTWERNGCQGDLSSLSVGIIGPRFLLLLLTLTSHLRKFFFKFTIPL